MLITVNNELVGLFAIADTWAVIAKATWTMRFILHLSYLFIAIIYHYILIYKYMNVILKRS